MSKAIINAVTKADEIEKLTTLKYRQELERLKSFHDKWMGYYNKILQSYPLDDDLTAASRFNMQMKKILEGTEEGGSSSELSKTASELERTFEAENERIANRTVKPGKVTVKASVKAAPVKTEEKKPAAKKSASEKMSEQRKSLIENGFDPIARISRYLEDAANIEMEEDSETSAAASAVPQAPAPQPPAAKNGDYADRSALGFSFEEALNPKEDLASIMKELGLFSDDE